MSNNTPETTWPAIKDLYDNLSQAGYTFDVSVNKCLVYRYDEPIFGMKDLNDPAETDESKGRMAHWSAALGAASAHLRFHPNQTPRTYPGLDY